MFSSIQENKRRSQGLPPSPGCCGGISEKKQQQAIAREQMICHLRAEQDREERMQEYILRKRKEEAEDLMTGVEGAAAKVSAAPAAPGVPATAPAPAPPIAPLAQYPGIQPVFVGRAPYGQGMCQAMHPYQMPNSNAPYAGSPVFYL